MPLEYNQFYLPDGATLFVYNEDASMIIGAYTSANNQSDMLFATRSRPGSPVSPLCEGYL